jgi:hypothetical protein
VLFGRSPLFLLTLGRGRYRVPPLSAAGFRGFVVVVPTVTGRRGLVLLLVPVFAAFFVFQGMFR